MTTRPLHTVSIIHPLAMALALGAACPVFSSDEVGASRRAAARMEEQVQSAMVLLNQARTKYAAGNYQKALELYRNSLESLPKAPVTEKRRVFIEESVADASVAVAQEFIKVGRYDEAESLLNAALKSTPTHKLAKQVLAQLKDPVRTNPALTPEHAKDVVAVNEKLHLAFGYYELGQYDEAVREFQRLLSIDPYNVAARRGLEQVNRARSNYYAAARDESRGEALAEVDAQWEQKGDPFEAPEVPESFSEALEESVVNVDQKLGAIILPKVSLDGVTVDEAVEYLRHQARQHDLSAHTDAERGVNISLDPGPPDSVSAKDVASKRISLKLTNVPLKEALQYVAKASGLLLRTNAYSAELVTPSAGSSFMVSKSVSLPPGFFSGLNDDGAGDSDPFSSDSGDTGLAVKRVDPKKALSQMGISFPEGSFVRYNSSNSTLFFHGTPRDLSLLEELVSTKSAQQPLQVVVNATFLEVNQNDLEELGFNWMVNINLDPNKWFLGGAGSEATGYNTTVADSAATIAGAASPGLVVGGLRSGGQVLTEDGIDEVIERGTSAKQGSLSANMAPSILTLRGIWSQADITMIMRGLSQKKGTDMVQHPSVMVRPGERASFYSGREFIYPTEYESPEIVSSYGNNNDYDNSNNNGDSVSIATSFPITPAHPSAFETRNLGTQFDVEVTGISEDKAIIDLNLAPEIVEFDGFVNYGNAISVPVVKTTNGKQSIESVVLSENSILQPVFSVRRVSTSVRIATGSTVLIGALKKSSIITYEDKIPVLGDIPWVGRLFRSHGTQEKRKAILILVKAEVVDPAGKKLYTPTSSYHEDSSELTSTNQVE